jgi:aarF domain-containing kinase
MKGFYVKAAQIIATRGDLFPSQYIDKLKEFSDNVDPMPAVMVRAIITQELIQEDETFEDVFVEFDNEPLGAASIAQVHRAVLSEKYGGREVAIKVQRPSIESKLMGDIKNLKLVAKIANDADISPVDYYTIFSELELQLADEFNFLEEAKAMDAIYNSLARSRDGTEERNVPVVIPRPVPGLASSRVLVMDFLQGTPLIKAQEKMEENGIKPGSPQSKLVGKKLVQALSDVFGRNILEQGLFHAGEFRLSLEYICSMQTLK